MKKIAILGSTGSIGTQTLDVVRLNGDIEVLGISAGSNVELLERQVREFHPRLAAVWKEEAARELAVRIADTETKVVSGMDGTSCLPVRPKRKFCDSYCRDDRNPPDYGGYQGREGYCSGK